MISRMKRMTQLEVTERLLSLRHHPDGRSLDTLERRALEGERCYARDVVYDAGENSYRRRVRTKWDEDGEDTTGKTFWNHLYDDWDVYLRPKLPLNASFAQLVEFAVSRDSIFQIGKSTRLSVDLDFGGVRVK